MKRAISISLLVLGVLVTQACTQDSLDLEMNEYCECMQAAKDDEGVVECRALIDALADKYAFDPDANDRIKKRLNDCASN